MSEQDNAKTDKRTEALADLELTAGEGEEIKAARGGYIPVYLHVIRNTDVTKSDDASE
jgi:hypothetical protein